jgi:exosortase
LTIIQLDNFWTIESLYSLKMQRRLLQEVMPFVALGVLWCLLIKHLSLYWTLDPQYSFGWLGPIICGYLLFVRWATRPAADLPQAGPARWLFWAAAILFLPTWLVEQPNPDWRLVSWLMALEVVTISLCVVYFLGGRSWLRHFAFSISLILATVPWQGDLEKLIVRGLMELATSVTVELLNLFHFPAVQHGSVIEVRTGFLGVDEACSGIRSLQATLMVSLFLGELYRTSWIRRAILIFIGVAVAFASNVGRTFLLAWLAASHGIESVPQWHDSAGFTVLSICFLLVWISARLLCGPIKRLQFSREPAASALPSGRMMALTAWLVFTVLGTELWYRTHETQETFHWSLVWPVGKERFSDVPIPYPLGDEGRAASWVDEKGNNWMVFFFKWFAGPPRSRILARLHRPEKCLPSAGYELREDRGVIKVAVKNLQVPFHVLNFNYDGKQVYVFYCLWQDHLKTAKKPRIRDYWDQRLVGLESVLLGERNLGQQTLEVVLFGYATPQEAEAAFRGEMADLITITG